MDEIYLSCYQDARRTSALLGGGDEDTDGAMFQLISKDSNLFF